MNSNSLPHFPRTWWVTRRTSSSLSATVWECPPSLRPASTRDSLPENLARRTSWPLNTSRLSAFPKHTMWINRYFLSLICSYLLQGKLGEECKYTELSLGILWCSVTQNYTEMSAFILNSDNSVGTTTKL